MRFSTRAEYGLRAMANLAQNYPKCISVKDISKVEGISVKYLERLIQELRKNNLVKSSKGKNGGYTLARNPKLLKVGKIVETLEGTIAPMKCNEAHCKIGGCSSRMVWNKLEIQIRKTLYGIKLSELI
ncbi:MAG: Rrf2 family transcriptional regulator [Candidatus Moranbacteria bacterium]|nr:Rrf2 family transcriptional regulator [Candidatus Moranbacteria bacterium]